MLDSISSGFVTTRISGQFLAKNRLSKRAKARLAVDILDHRVEVRDLTVRQVAHLCRVSVTSINNTRRTPAQSLAKAWAAAPPDQRAEFIRRADPDRVFDVIAQVIA